MNKFVVLCGQTVTLENIEPFQKEYQETHFFHIFPEGNSGTEGLRQLVKQTIKLGIPTVFITRFNTILEEFANAVYEKTVEIGDFKIILVRYVNKTDWYITEHTMSKDCETLGNDWPIGILW